MDLPRITRNAVSSTQGEIRDDAKRAQARAFFELAESARSVGNAVRKREIGRGQRDAQSDFSKADANTEDGNFVEVEDREGKFLDFLSVRDDAYEQATQALQVTRAERDARVAVASIRSETFASPTKYNEAVDAWKKEYLGNADPTLAGAVSSQIETIFEKGHIEVIEERESSDIKEARSSIDSTLTGIEKDIEALLADGGPDVASGEQFQELNNLREFWQHQRSENPLYLYSEEERDLDDRNFQRRVETAALTPQIRSVFEQEGRAGALEAVDAIIEELNLAPSEAVAMGSSLRNQVNSLQEIEAAQEAEISQADARRKKFFDKAGDDAERNLIDTLSRDGLSQEQKLEAVRASRDYLSPATYDKFVQRIAGGTGNDGASASGLGLAISLARDGVLTEEDVITGGFSEGQVRTLMSEVEKYDKVVAKRGKAILDGAFAKGVFDSLDPLIEATEAQAREDFNKWIDENPEATPEMAASAAREISVSNGRRVDFSQYTRFFQGETPDQLDIAEDAILDDPSLTPQEQARELQRVSNIRKIVSLDNAGGN